MTFGNRVHDRPEQIFVPGDRQLGVQAALHQNFDAADIHHFLNLLEDDLARQNVAVLMAGDAIKVAEPAAHPADVGVVDVAAHDVGDNRLRVLAPANKIGQFRQVRQVRVLEQAQGVRRRDAFARVNLVSDVVNGREGGSPTVFKFPLGQCHCLVSFQFKNPALQSRADLPGRKVPAGLRSGRPARLCAILHNVLIDTILPLRGLCQVAAGVSGSPGLAAANLSASSVSAAMARISSSEILHCRWRMSWMTRSVLCSRWRSTTMISCSAFWLISKSSWARISRVSALDVLADHNQRHQEDLDDVADEQVRDKRGERVERLPVQAGDLAGKDVVAGPEDGPDHDGEEEAHRADLVGDADGQLVQRAEAVLVLRVGVLDGRVVVLEMRQLQPPEIVRQRGLRCAVHARRRGLFHNGHEIGLPLPSIIKQADRFCDTPHGPKPDGFLGCTIPMAGKTKETFVLQRGGFLGHASLLAYVDAQRRVPAHSAGLACGSLCSSQTLLPDSYGIFFRFSVPGPFLAIRAVRPAKTGASPPESNTS